MPAMSAPPQAGRRAAATGALLALLCLVVARMLAVPVDEFGANGAAWAEHRARVGWAAALVEHAGEDTPRPFAELLRERATGFPPGLHLVAAAARPVVGDSAGAHSLFGLVWLLLLAGSVAVIARTLFDSGGAAAFAGVLLLPVLPAAAGRYYYDFPMVAASWAAAALLAATMDRRASLLGGAAAGAVAVGACLLKWTALPTMAPLLLGLLLAPTPGRRPLRRAAAAVALVAVLWGGVAAFLSAVGPDNSLVAMVQESRVGDLDHPTEAVLQGPGGLGSVIRSVAGALTSPQPDLGPRAAWYAVSGISAVLSPVGAVLLLALVPLRRAPFDPLVPLLVCVAGSTAVLLLVLVAPVDERFLLGAAPAAVLLGVCGWLTRSPTGRRQAGAVVLTAGVLLAADFHHGPRAPWNAALELRVMPQSAISEAHIPPITLRGVGLASSFERRGWVRRDDPQPARQGARQAVWSWVQECGADTVILDVDAPLIAPDGDFSWFEYQSARAALRVAPAPGVLALDCEQPALPGAVVLSPWTDRARARPPRCGADYAVVEVIGAPDTGPHVAAWSPDGLATCAQLRAAREAVRGAPSYEEPAHREPAPHPGPASAPDAGTPLAPGVTP